MSEFKVELQNFEQLSTEEQLCASNNGFGKEYANYVRVTNDGMTLFLENDAMEPEDCRFSRDLAWVLTAIRTAYDIGRASRG